MKSKGILYAGIIIVVTFIFVMLYIIGSRLATSEYVAPSGALTQGTSSGTLSGSDTSPIPTGGEKATSTPGAGTSSAGDVDCGEVKCIALSFDDGPRDVTPQILDILEEKDVIATFFIWGAKFDGKTYVQREADAGMEIGNHTWNHKNLKTLTPEEIEEEIQKTSDSIEAAIGKRPTLMRPPYGKVDAQVREVSKKLGLSVILWNVDPQDWRDEDPSVMRKFFRKNATPGGIVDMHARKETVEALPQVIDELRSQGYTFVTISQLIGEENLEPGVVYTSRTGKRE